MDKYNLNRFLEAQLNTYTVILTELSGGKKRSHWMWYIFPQLEGLGYSRRSNYYGIQAKNTNAVTKTWEAKYQGPIRLTWRNGENNRFHNFYLVNQRVEFSISDDPFITYSGKRYYVINFDGQW